MSNNTLESRIAKLEKHLANEATSRELRNIEYSADKIADEIDDLLSDAEMYGSSDILAQVELLNRNCLKLCKLIEKEMEL